MLASEREIMPIKANEYPSSVGGIGDILQRVFFSPKNPVHGWIIGAGPASGTAELWLRDCAYG